MNKKVEIVKKIFEGLFHNQKAYSINDFILDHNIQLKMFIEWKIITKKRINEKWKSSNQNEVDKNRNR